jgi:hypothetical protein
MGRMFELRVGKKVYGLSLETDFEAHYFYMLRESIDCIGTQKGRILFKIVSGAETNAQRKRLLVSDPSLWIRPTHEQVLGLIGQFSNLTLLARKMGISRLTIGKWKRGNSKVSFLAWHFMTQLLGIGEQAAKISELKRYEMPREAERHGSRKG